MAPLLEDVKTILTQLQEFSPGIRDLVEVRLFLIAFGLWTVTVEVCRGLTIIVVAWLICGTIRSVW